MKSPVPVSLCLYAGVASAGNVLWSGLFNESYTVADFDKWSWSNPVPPYQWYIHGSGSTSSYLALDASYKNPKSTLEEAKGLRTTLDETSSWNGQTMMRTELIPQVADQNSAEEELGSGKKFYHFSLGVKEDGFPVEKVEHQVAFFESHFTELKYGGTSDNAANLTWYANSQEQWSTALTAGTWYNFAYGIDFDAGSVALYASEGGDDLVKVVDAVEGVSAQTNGQDWHVGVLRLDNGESGLGEEEWFWSGVFVEGGEISLKV
ncbi:hypothetical protein BDV18DRAFT_160364 [Aspergillus unguis]